MTPRAIAKWSFFSRELLEGLFHRALRMAGNESDAWDLVQDTLERGLRRWSEPPADEGAVRWLWVVLRTRHLDRVRSCHWRAAMHAEPDAVDKLPAPEPAELPMWRTVDPVLVRRALRLLPPQQRQVLLMQSRDRLSLQEIANALKVPVATAGTRAHRARNRLRVILTEDVYKSAAGEPA
jgi:RNA polymerase sigma-70 factor (ECF subfamily)